MKMNKPTLFAFFVLLVVHVGRAQEAVLTSLPKPSFMPVAAADDPTNDTAVALKIAVKPFHFAKTENTTVIRHTGYITLMHNVYHIPAWTYHRISKEQLKTVDTNSKRRGGYPKDAQYQALKSTMYDGSGYQHGHMAPAADFKRNSTLHRESNYMTNMAPQHGCLNEIGWCYLESMTRNWASESGSTVTHVVSGCLLGNFKDSLCYPNGFKVYVPAYFYKAILIEDTLHPEKSRAIGFIVANDYLSKEAAQLAQCSIDDIERLTGLNLFMGCTQLDENELLVLEKTIGTFSWNFTTDCGTKNCESVYSGKRIHPKTRKKLKCGT